MRHIFDTHIGDLELDTISHDSCNEANSQILLKVKSNLASSIKFSRTIPTVPQVTDLRKVRFMRHAVVMFWSKWIFRKKIDTLLMFHMTSFKFRTMKFLRKALLNLELLMIVRIGRTFCGWNKYWWHWKYWIFLSKTLLLNIDTTI